MAQRLFGLPTPLKAFFEFGIAVTVGAGFTLGHLYVSGRVSLLCSGFTSMKISAFTH